MATVPSALVRRSEHEEARRRGAGGLLGVVRAGGRQAACYFCVPLALPVDVAGLAVLDEVLAEHDQGLSVGAVGGQAGSAR